MNDRSKANQELLEEISSLKKRIQELEKSDAEHKQEEKTLKENNDKFLSLASTIPGNIAYVNANTLQYEFVNDTFEKSFGIPREKIIGQHIKDIIGEANYKFAINYIEEVRLGKSISYENTFDLVSGKRWIQVNYTPVTDANGLVASIAVLSLDITERKKAEEALKAAEETYRNIFLNAQTGLFRTDINTGLILDVNDCVARFIGYRDREELLSKPFNIAERYVDPKDRERMISLLREHGQFSNFEARFRRNDDSIMWMRFAGRIVSEKGWIEGVSEDITKEKDAEGELRAWIKRYDLIVEASGQVAYEYILSTGHITWGSSIEGVLGYPMEDISGGIVQWQELLHPEDREATLAALGNAEKACTYWDTEYRMRHKRGDYVWIRDRGFFLPDAEGKAYCQLGMMEDITERKQAVEALQHEKILYEDLVTTQPSGVYRLRVKFRGDWQAETWRSMMESTYSVDLASDRYCNILGISHEEFMANPGVVPDLIHPDDKQDFNAKNAQAMTSLTHFTWEGRISSHHQTRWVHLESIPRVLDSETVLWTGIVYDITEQKQAENALLESEERYRNVVENSQEGIFQTTPEGRFRMANQATARILGYDSPRELIESVTDITHQIYVNPEDRIKNLANLDLHDMDLNIELQFYRKDGSVIWVSAQTQSVRDKNGNVICYEGMIQDITDRKNNAEKLKKALGGTVQAIASLAESRDPYTAGHQQRVAGLAAAIAEEMGLSPEQIEGLTMGCIIHDIGKVSVPADILNIPRKLTAIEFGLVKAHVQSGHDIVKDIEFPWPVARMILEHHERIDGSGYPNGLTGDKLLLESRIMEVADVVEAMVSHRPYRAALGIDAALEEIEKNMGIIYDADVADTCLKLFREKGYQLI